MLFGWEKILKQRKLLVVGSILLLLVVLFVEAGGARQAEAAPVRVSARSTVVTMYTTAYSYTDGSRPSAYIAYPRKAGYPTRHNLATEGRGTYADPVTMASYRGELPIGSIVYVPYLRKYFVMEDACGQCSYDWRYHRRWHIDLWVGPRVITNRAALRACEYSLTRPATKVILHPAHNLIVDQTLMFTNNHCTVHFH